MDDRKLKRVNIRMSEDIFNYYDNIAKTWGVSRSFAMVMGLKGYIDSQESLKSMAALPDLIAKAEALKDDK